MFELNHKLSAINHNLQRGTEPPQSGVGERCVKEQTVPLTVQTQMERTRDRRARGIRGLHSVFGFF
jgi:hypothetical protein